MTSVFIVLNMSSVAPMGFNERQNKLMYAFGKLGDSIFSSL